jgi:hypothetical protein
MKTLNVTFLNRNKGRLHNGRRLPRNLSVDVAVNPRKGVEAALITAGEIATRKFGKVKLVSFV